jgi:hypothetical protein
MQGKYIEKFVTEAVADALAGPLQDLRKEIDTLRQQLNRRA